MTNMRRFAVSVAVTALTSGVLGAADDPTTGLLKAERVTSAVHLRVASSAVKEATQAEIEYALAQDPQKFFPLTSSVTFVASRPIKVAYQKLNPLAIQVTSSIATAADPSNAALVKFTEAILKIPKIVAPDQKQGGGTARLETCPGFKELVKDLTDLQAKITEDRTISTDLNDWRSDIDKAPGYVSVGQTITKIGAKASKVETNAKEARRLLAQIRDRVAKAETTELANRMVAESEKKRLAAEMELKELKAKSAPAKKGAKPSSNSSAGAVEPRNPPAGATAMTTGSTTTNPADKPAEKSNEASTEAACNLDILLQKAFVALLGTGDVDARILELDELAADLKGLKASLSPFGEDGNWDGDSYVFAAVAPAPDTIKTLSVKVAPVTLTSVPTEGVVREVQDKKAASANLVIRQFSTFAPEIGAGLVVSSIHRPSYGTTTNAAGQTVVARKDSQDVSLGASVMLNSVCRCGMDSFAYPMFQTGALVDPKSPGILFGAGLRFIRPTHLGLSTGAALVWIKDLDKLTVGAPVGGTTDIDNDLKFRTTVKMYFNLQYTF